MDYRNRRDGDRWFLKPPGSHDRESTGDRDGMNDYLAKPLDRSFCQLVDLVALNLDPNDFHFAFGFRHKKSGSLPPIRIAVVLEMLPKDRHGSRNVIRMDFVVVTASGGAEQVLKIDPGEIDCWLRRCRWTGVRLFVFPSEESHVFPRLLAPIQPRRLP